MSAAAAVLLRAIGQEDVILVARFLHDSLNARLSVETWRKSIIPTWDTDVPNHGFMLTSADHIVGVNLAFYSERLLAGATHRFCNLAALSVRPEFRGHAFRLVRAIAAQPGFHFTDLSPSGNVVEMNRRLRFRALDTTCALAVNRPGRSRGVRIETDSTRLTELLTGRDFEIYTNHRNALAARHLVAVDGQDTCYVVFRKDRRKRLPVFASLLHVSNPEFLPRIWSSVAHHLLVRHGAAATLMELRLVSGYRPWGARLLAHPRPKMFKSSLDESQIDNLYSELTCVPW